ncbi:FecR family protein [Paucibacter sp. M5-1]|uniref:FecR family protein n=1 Tax=Paucibacter sp. M5-1 TaxID=3015998 RepID=UPI0022B86F0C|nr:FecR domain-containing protein [Paucibacter sp. M5-1]MCZ7880516.1 FecR domain-containing protein [Paucibacter sp. M5-1]MCZ7880561.1 FecR domain-containing protein [Paucibacter sp. M5-1]
MVPNDRQGRQGRAQNPLDGGREPPVVTRRVAEEAAAWIARLHGPDRSAEMDRKFREWVSRSPAHGYAFERCTDIWTDVASMKPEQIVAGMAGAKARDTLARERRWQRMRWPLGALLAVSVVVAAYALHRWLAVAVYATEVGGQQQVLLADGTRISLNTDTRVRVELDSARRTVSLDAGEVMFEVAKDPLRPFVVRAGGSEVIAVGTVFSVRVPGRSSEGREGREAALAVALIEGAVTVQPVSAGQEAGMAPQQRITLQPGERMRLAKPQTVSTAPALVQIDRPPLEPLFAWKHGKAIFENVSLGEAVAEMNRYSPISVVLFGNVASLRVGGAYDIGDARGFVRAVAELHGLQVREQAGRLELAAPQ